MEIRKSAAALLVIDAIEAVGADSLYDPDAATAAYRSAVARAAGACRAAGVPVIFCNDAHVRGYDRELELWGEHGVAGETRVFPEVGVGERDIVVPKRRYSGFFQTDLDLTLRELGVTDQAQLKEIAASCASSAGSYRKMTHEEIYTIFMEGF